MCCNSGQCITESKTVRQEDICRFNSKLLFIELLSQQNIAEERFGWRYVSIIGIPRATWDMPTTFFDIFFHQFILKRVILFHPVVFHSAFKVKYIIGIMLKQIEVSDQCMLEVFVNGCLYIPVPLSIQMRIRDYISFVLFLCLQRTESCCSK